MYIISSFPFPLDLLNAEVTYIYVRQLVLCQTTRRQINVFRTKPNGQVHVFAVL